MQYLYAAHAPIKAQDESSKQCAEQAENQQTPLNSFEFVELLTKQSQEQQKKLATEIEKTHLEIAKTERKLKQLEAENAKKLAQNLARAEKCKIMAEALKIISNIEKTRAAMLDLFGANSQPTQNQQ